MFLCKNSFVKYTRRGTKSKKLKFHRKPPVSSGKPIMVFTKNISCIKAISLDGNAKINVLTYEWLIFDYMFSKLTVNLGL